MNGERIHEGPLPPFAYPFAQSWMAPGARKREGRQRRGNEYTKGLRPRCPPFAYSFVHSWMALGAWKRGGHQRMEKRIHEGPAPLLPPIRLFICPFVDGTGSLEEGRPSTNGETNSRRACALAAPSFAYSFGPFVDGTRSQEEGRPSTKGERMHKGPLPPFAYPFAQSWMAPGAWRREDPCWHPSQQGSCAPLAFPNSYLDLPQL